MKKTIAGLLLLVLLPSASAENETAQSSHLAEADLEAIETRFAAQLVPLYQEWADLRSDMHNQSLALQLALAGVRAELEAIQGNTTDQNQLAIQQARRLDGLETTLTGLESRLSASENLTAEIHASLTSGQVKVDEGDVAAAVQNVLGGQAFQSRLENGVKAAGNDLATKDDVAAAAAAQPGIFWFLLPAILLLGAGVAYHLLVIKRLIEGRPRPAKEPEPTTEAEATEEDYEEARRRVEATLCQRAQRSHEPPAQQSQEPPVAPTEAVPVLGEAQMAAIVAAIQANQPPEPAAASAPVGRNADKNRAEAVSNGLLSATPGQSQDIDDHRPETAHEGTAHLDAPTGAAQEEALDDAESSSPPASTESDEAETPAAKHWREYQEGKLDPEALQFALADAYPDIREREAALRQAKEAT